MAQNPPTIITTDAGNYDNVPLDGQSNSRTSPTSTNGLDVDGQAGRHHRNPSNASYLSTDGKTALSPSTTRYTGSEYATHEGGSVKGLTSRNDPIEMEQVADKKSPFGKLKGLFKKKKEQDSDGNKTDEEEVKFSAHIDPASDMTDPTPFFHKPYALASLVDPKSLDDLEAMGGIDGLLHGLGVDGEKGLTGVAAPAGAHVEAGRPEGPASTNPRRALEAQYKASLADREKIYGKNYIEPKKTKSLFQLMWMAMKDKVLIILGIAAVISLALGIYQSVGVEHSPVVTRDCPEGCIPPSVEWVEGVAILVAVSIVVLVGSVNDWQKELQFKKLNEKKDDRMVNCIRNGQRMTLNTKDIVVGDVCVLETGEILPVDGVFLRGHNVKADESGATGESDLIKKFPYEECLEERNSLPEGKKGKKDCFLLSGSKIADGVGEYVVIAVGKTSFNGRLLMALRGEAEGTPLQAKLNRLAELIATVGATAGGTLFFALFIRFCVGLRTRPDRTADEKGQNFISILIISVTLVVVAVPEGLPLAVTLALAFATKRMTKENLLVRVLASCETAGGANVICTDKTGTLTMNEMRIVAMALGVNAKGVARLEENENRSNANKVADESGIVEAENSRQGRADYTFDLKDTNNVASPQLQKLLNESFVINSTAFEETSPEGKISIVGSKTEAAMLILGRELGWGAARESREKANIAQQFPFSSEAKCMGTVLKLDNGKYRLLVKGASEILLRAATHHVVVGEAGQSSSTEIETVRFNEETMTNMQRTITFYASQCLRTIAVCYKDYESWPPKSSGEELALHELVSDLTMITTVAIEDPLRPGVIEAIATCAKAGVSVKMVTGDNILTARSIAEQCRLLSPGGIVIEGPAFRRLSPTEQLEIAPRMQVMARCSPEDKRRLVECLRELGMITCVTGDGSNDSPAIKAANVGLSMGIAGTEVAKEASDIIIMDDSFASIVTAVKWGRSVNDAVRKFLQFQLSVNFTAIVITFVSAVASDEEQSVLTATQLLWVNLIMDTFAALALATDPASDRVLNRHPERADSPLIGVHMVKQIVGQGFYQIIIALVLHFGGHKFFGLERGTEDDTELKTFVFNAFTFCQIFNSLNARSLTNDLNFWHGVHRNYYFMVIFAIMVGGQTLIVFVGGAAFTVTRLRASWWGASIALGFGSIPVGALIRLLPTAPVERIYIKMGLLPDPNALPTIKPSVLEAEKFDYNDAITQTHNNLSLFTTIRSGPRLQSKKLKIKSRSRRMKDANIHHPTLLTMAPSLLLGALGGGQNWLAPVEKLGGPAAQEPGKIAPPPGKIAKIVFHPDTDKNDDIYRKYNGR